MSANGDHAAQPDWRRQRARGLVAILASMLVFVGLWLGIRYGAPSVPGMDSLGARMLFALKACCVAVLFCFATGIDAVAHERLQSPAFDPLQGHETHRMRINLRYLQNTLEQTVLFVVSLFGLAAYSPGGEAMRAVEATAIVWVLARLAFWIGYHRSAAMRGLGAAGLALTPIVLIYVAARVGFDIAGTAGAVVVLAAFLLFEAVLFRTTRARDADEPI